MTATIDSSAAAPSSRWEASLIADSTWAAIQGREKLKVDWENGPHASYNSAEYRKQLEASARQPGKAFRDVGNVDAEFAKGGKVIEAGYYAPHLSHAPMEPPVAVADYRDGKVEAWTCTQNPRTQDIVAGVFGIRRKTPRRHAAGRWIRANEPTTWRLRSFQRRRESRQSRSMQRRYQSSISSTRRRAT
jgi:isoquinoline 1-oxidoreductase beta subunit